MMGLIASILARERNIMAPGRIGDVCIKRIERILFPLKLICIPATHCMINIVPIRLGAPPMLE